MSSERKARLATSPEEEGKITGVTLDTRPVGTQILKAVLNKFRFRLSLSRNRGETVHIFTLGAVKSNYLES